MSERVKRSDVINYLFRLLFIFSLCLLVTSSVWGDFQTGEDAYYQGDYATALKEFLPLAEQGDGKAQYRLGCMYEFGNGMRKDEEEADLWYRKAHPKLRLLAEQGDAEAQYYLGGMYSDGDGVDKDETEGEKWYSKAYQEFLPLAEQGDGKAQYRLGYMYNYGYGVEENDVEAVRWYRKAAEQGHARAQVSLGYMYDKGYGVSKDYAEAVGWYRKAAEQGYDRGQYNLGVMYRNGRGVAKDDVEAVGWYRKAAEQGYASAQNNLGWMYDNGYGVAKDYITAYMWYILAEAGGEKQNAPKNRENLSKKMTSAQIAEARRRADEWKRRKEQPPESKPQATSSSKPKAKVPPALPPILSIEEITFSEGVLDAEETATLKIRIKNVGPGDARNLKVELSGELQGVSFPRSTDVPTIAKGGGEQTVAIRIRGGHDLPTATASLAIRVIEPQFNQRIQGKRLRFSTRAFRSPELFLADAAVVEGTSASPNNRIDVNEMVELKFYVQNKGIGAAEQVAVEVENTQAGVRFLGVGSHYVQEAPLFSRIEAGKYELVTYTYFVDSRFTASELRFKINVRERYRKYGFSDVKAVAINTELDAFGTIAELPRDDVGSHQRVEIEDLPDLEIDVRKDIPKTSMTNPQAVAVVIGNRNYTYLGVPDVDFAHNDALIVKEYLIRTLGYKQENILYRQDATKGTFEEVFGTKDNHQGKLFNYVSPEGLSDIFIYYSGHGAPDVKSPLATKPSYLVPVDANPSNVSFGGYPLDVLYQNLKQTPYRHATVVIDACFSGTSAGGTLIGEISGLGLPTLEIPGISQDRSAIFTATGSQQVANWYRDKQHSLFTYFFLKALRGEADGDGDNRLTASEISEYVHRHVLSTARRYHSRDQNPQLIGNQDAVLVTY